MVETGRKISQIAFGYAALAFMSVAIISINLFPLFGRNMLPMLGVNVKYIGFFIIPLIIPAVVNGLLAYSILHVESYGRAGKKLMIVGALAMALFALFSAVTISLKAGLIPAIYVVTNIILLVINIYLAVGVILIVKRSGYNIQTTQHDHKVEMPVRPAEMKPGKEMFNAQNLSAPRLMGDLGPGGYLSATLLVFVNLGIAACVVLRWFSFIEMLWLYWAEVVIIGVLNIPKMLVAAVFGDHLEKIKGRNDSGEGTAFLLLMLLFYAAAFAICMLLFAAIMFLPELVDVPGGLGVPFLGGSLDLGIRIQIALAALGVSHGVSFVVNFLYRREFSRSSLQSLTIQPFLRAVAIILVIVLASIVVSAMPGLSKTMTFTILVIGLKIAVDFYAHLAERRRFQPLSIEEMQAFHPAQATEPSGVKGGVYLSAALLVCVNMGVAIYAMMQKFGLADLLVLYWAEIVVIGVLNIPKMLIVAVTGLYIESPGDLFDRILQLASAFKKILFFVLAFAFLCLLLLGVIMLLLLMTSGIPFIHIFSQIDMMLATITLSHLVSFFIHFMYGREFRWGSLQKLTRQPLARVSQIFLVLLLAAIAAFIQPVLSKTTAFILAVVGLKIAADLYAHLAERRRFRSASDPAQQLG